MFSCNSRMTRVARTLGVLMFVMALAMPASMALAKSSTDHFTIKGASPDNGSCGLWADDTYELKVTVVDNHDGTFAVRYDYVGAHFVTRAGASPGACQTTDANHGTSVVAGIKGKMDAFFSYTVTSATYNPNGCGPANRDCTTRGEFTGAVFGCPGESCATGDYVWDFQYSSNDHRLIYSYWRDQSINNGGNDLFTGDIATS